MVDSKAALSVGVAGVFYCDVSEDPDLAGAKGFEFNVNGCSGEAGFLLGPSVEPFKLVDVKENGHRLHLSLSPLFEL